jgi:hypothetical protein
MRIVSQAKTAWIPAEFPAVRVNQVRDRPDQRFFPHVTAEVRFTACKRDFVHQPVPIQVAEFLNSCIDPKYHGRKIQIGQVMGPGNHEHLHQEGKQR